VPDTPGEASLRRDAATSSIPTARSEGASGLTSGQTPSSATTLDSNAPLKTAEKPAAKAGERRAPSRRGRWDKRELTAGSVRKHVWKLGWPQVTEQVFSVVDDISDLFWAGRLPEGYRAIGGIGVAQAILQVTGSLRMGLEHAARAMISRAVGAGDLRLANHITMQFFTLNAFLALLLALIGIFLTDHILYLVGVKGDIHSLAATYMRLQMIGRLPVFLRIATNTALQASGDVITPLRATTVTRILHITLVPVLMFGWFGLPAMGLAGVAWATMIAHGCGGLVNSYALFYGNTRLRLKFSGYRMDFPLMGRILRLAAPASLSGTERTTSQVLLLRLVTPFGDVATAVYALLRRVENIAQLGSNGFGHSSGVMVGQNLGARQPDRARQSVRWGIVYVLVMQAVMGTVMAVFAPQVIRPFASDPEVVALGVVWLRLLVGMWMLLAVATVFQQSYNTAGDTWTPLVVTVGAAWLVEIPLSWFLLNHTGVGPTGLAFAATIGMAVRLACYVPYYFWGRWLRIQVIQ
jgi:putative MATE family efflux protein